MRQQERIDRFALEAFGKTVSQERDGDLWVMWLRDSGYEYRGVGKSWGEALDKLEKELQRCGYDTR